MIEIVVGTDRENSFSLKLGQFIHQLYKAQKVEAELLDVGALNLADVQGGGYFKGAKGSFKDAVDRVTRADGLVMIVPEYNGSYPGMLKLFIDYWKYPETFENRPVAFVGLGGRWGGLRPVEHLQQVFGYRNAYIFPNRVFLSNVKDVLQDGQVKDALILDLLKTQVRDFPQFIAALKSAGLDANSKRK